jgi:cytochrome c-type biogenesis protein CcmH/NrfF
MNEVISVIAENWIYWGVPVVFLVIVAWIYRPGARRRYKSDGSIPFENDGEETMAQRRSHYPP